MPHGCYVLFVDDDHGKLQLYTGYLNVIKDPILITLLLILVYELLLRCQQV